MIFFNKNSTKSLKLGFTLVELLAVIVILAIILVIAVPKVISVIEDAKKATLESTAKMIASAAEKAKVQNTVLNKDKEINCKDIVKLNDLDFERCIIEFYNDTAKVTIKGSGKFSNLNVCSGDKTSATASDTACSVTYGKATTYISKLNAFDNINNGLINPKIRYENTMYDTGIRYSGSLDEVKNKVYYNCEDMDAAGVTYGESNYDYASSCEVWRIIGVFDVDNGTGIIEKKVKIINSNSLFKASWDSSANDVNNGWGINQWGESTYEDGEEYKGADLMQMLNGYYIGKENTTCEYCITSGQSDCLQICTSESLTTINMKPITNNAKNMIEKVLWNTYAVKNLDNSLSVDDVYLQENGISTKYTGKGCYFINPLDEVENKDCNDKVIRTTGWNGLVGLSSVSDIMYSNGWLAGTTTFEIYPWLITSYYEASSSKRALYSYVGNIKYASVYAPSAVWPTVYLKSDIQIIDGNGCDEPYILK